MKNEFFDSFFCFLAGIVIGFIIDLFALGISDTEKKYYDDGRFIKTSSELYIDKITNIQYIRDEGSLNFIPLYDEDGNFILFKK